MLYRDQEGLKMSQKSITYIRNGEEIQQDIGVEGEAWWQDFAEKWAIEVIEIRDKEYTPEQFARFEEIKDMQINETVLQAYVEDGITGEGLEVVALKKENEELKQLLADLIETILLGGNL